MLLFLLSTALAADPVVERLDDSWIQGRVEIAAGADEVWKLLEHPGKVAAISGQSTARAEPEPESDCQRVFTVVDHPIATAEYTSRACPDGEYAMHQTLIGGDMKEFESRWWVEPGEEDASTLHYRVRTIPKFMVPQFIVDRASVKSLVRTLEKLRDHFEPA